MFAYIAIPQLHNIAFRFFLLSPLPSSSFFFFFFNDTATTEIYTLSLHDALPILAPPKPVFEAPKFDAAKPARPRPTVHTGGLSAVSFAPPTVHKNAQHVQTGGFGDPYGLPGPGDPKKRANIAQRGSFGLPQGAGFGDGFGGGEGGSRTSAGRGGAAQAR